MRKATMASLVVLCATGAAQAGFLAGVGNFGNFSQQTLYRIDPSTGAATPIGSTGLNQIADIAWDASSETLYALTVGADLYRLNQFTGAATLIRANPLTLPEGGLTVDATGLISASTSLSGVSFAGVISGGATIGDGSLDISGLASVSGQLIGYAKNLAGQHALVEIMIGGAVNTLVAFAPTSGSAVGGLTVGEAGELLISDGVNLLLGSGSGVSVIGAHGVAGMSGIAWVPSPSAAALLGVVGLTALRRRR